MAKKFNVEEIILKHAVDLFYQHGFVKASIRDIAKPVGISNSTAYLYFKNKYYILFEIMRSIGDELSKELQAVIDKNDDAVKCLEEMIFRQICFSAESNNYKKARIFLEEHNQLPGYLGKKILERHRQIYNLYYSKVCEVEKSGMLNKKGHNTVITFCILGMMNWVIRWFNPIGSLSIEDVAKEIIDIFFRGFLRKGVGETKR